VVRLLQRYGSVMAREPLAADDVRAFVGTTLREGRYVISGVLGSGSQGATLAAVDKKHGREVAIKRFQVRGARSWKDVELAEREARVLAALQHRLLPRALDHFEEEGALYLVMDKIDGSNLASCGTLGRNDVIRFLRDAAEVLSYLHGRAPPVIHRDIKPANVIRRPARAEADERVDSFVLVDFGSVRAQLKPKGGSTVVGTFGYMAPEQFQGRALPCSDVYAVGVTALRMLTNVEPEDLPHRGLAIDVAAVLDADDPLTAALMAMLNPDPDERASSIAPLLTGLSLDEEDDPAGGEPPPRIRFEPDLPASDRYYSTQQQEPSADPAPPEPLDLPPLVRVLFVLGLSVARIVVAAVLGLAAPVLLSVLALLFGKGLNRAAEQVRQVASKVNRDLARATTRVHGRSQRHGHGRHQRIETDVASTPGGDKKTVIDEAVEELEASMEQLDEEISERHEKRRRR